MVPFALNRKDRDGWLACGSRQSSRFLYDFLLQAIDGTLDEHTNGIFVGVQPLRQLIERLLLFEVRANGCLIVSGKRLKTFLHRMPPAFEFLGGCGRYVASEPADRTRPLPEFARIKFIQRQFQLGVSTISEPILTPIPDDISYDRGEPGFELGETAAIKPLGVLTDANHRFLNRGRNDSVSEFSFFQLAGRQQTERVSIQAGQFQ